jgi:hypothetical protein
VSGISAQPDVPFGTSRLIWTVNTFRALPLLSQMTLGLFGAATASLAHTLPEGRWHIKGSTALIAYIGPSARLPRDLDVSIGASAAAPLLRSRQLPSIGGKKVQVVRAEQIRFMDMRHKPPVHRMLLRISNSHHVLGEIVANVLIVPDSEARTDQRLARVTFPTVAVAVPAAQLTRCLAQKLLRYTRRRSGNRVNTRWADLYDFLIAARSPVTNGLRAQDLREDVDVEFAYMRRPMPTEIPPPPAEWLDYWDTEMFRTGAAFGQLNEATSRLFAFWAPVLTSAPPASARWNPIDWMWE